MSPRQTRSALSHTEACCPRVRPDTCMPSPPSGGVRKGFVEQQVPMRISTKPGDGSTASQTARSNSESHNATPSGTARRFGPCWELFKVDGWTQEVAHRSCNRGRERECRSAWETNQPAKPTNQLLDALPLPHTPPPQRSVSPQITVLETLCGRSLAECDSAAAKRRRDGQLAWLVAVVRRPCPLLCSFSVDLRGSDGVTYEAPR